MLRECLICGKEFEANKYKPSQKVCCEEGCQNRRQIHNMREWRRKNKGYFDVKVRLAREGSTWNE